MNHDLLPSRTFCARGIIAIGIFFALFLSTEAYTKSPFGLGARLPTPQEEELLKGKIKEIREIRPNQLALRRYYLSPGEKVGLASSVKNYEYLPKVGSQGEQGSCSAWAACYYHKTYQESKEYNWGAPDPGIDPQHVFSPAFGYNLANLGQDGGSSIEVIMTYIIADHGCATWQDMPYNESDYVSWPTEEVWRNAIPYRAESVGEIDLTTDTGIENLKQHLANGDLAVIAITPYDNFWDYPNGNKTDNNVIYDNSDSHIYNPDLGGHALTVIGYDDNKSYNDGTGIKYGAFYIVNSWGEEFSDGRDVGIYDSDIGSKGFYWFSYTYVRDKCKADPDQRKAWTMTDKQGYIPTAYGIFGLNHDKRGELIGYFLGGNDKDHPDWDFLCFLPLGGEHPVNQNIVVDLTSYTAHFDKKIWLGVYDLSENDPNFPDFPGSDTTGQVTYMSVQRVGDSEIISPDTPEDTIDGGFIYVELGANQPPNTPSNPSPANGATDQSIDVDLRWTGGDPDSDPVTYDVYFKANDSNFGEPVSPGQSGTTYDPGTLSYETQYYWRIVATDDHGASTSGSVWDFITGSSGRHENETFSLPAGKWKMISVPFTLDDPSPNAVLVDDLGSQNDAVWKLYRWNAANGSYDKYPYTGDFAAAKAFWIVSKDAKEVDTGPGTDVSRETDFVINLPSGWSQIGNPFPFSVAWGEVRVRKNSEVVSISEAQARGWVRDKIWSWDGDSYIYYPAPGGELLPYEGHWVRALLNCELLVPPGRAQEARAWEQVIKPKQEFLQLKARVGNFEDSYNFLGFYQTAKDGYDRLDVEEAPPISPYISLFLPHPEWGKNKGNYTQDIRARIPQATKWIWDFQVETDQINKEIVLEWENTLAFPEELHLYLTDSFSNVLANMREKSSYSFISPSGLESFKIIATSEALPLPEELHLSEIYSYPNPAHGEGVQFHFHLASSAKVTIKMYSVSGELVRTLIEDEAYLPGAYEEFWKEDNDRGEKLARGLYIFIIQAGNPAKAMSKSGKVVLLD